MQHTCIYQFDPCRTPQVVIAAAGFEADASTLKKVIQRRNVTYQHNHKKPMSVAATAQLVGNTLYYKRFFPYYSFTLVAGLDTEGDTNFAGLLDDTSAKNLNTKLLQKARIHCPGNDVSPILFKYQWCLHS